MIEKLKQKEKKLLTSLNIYPSLVFFPCALSNLATHIFQI